LIEEKLFDRRRDLFTDLSAVFMDTTSLSGAGAQDNPFSISRTSEPFPDLTHYTLKALS
jgi:hypothetical protein